MKRPSHGLLFVLALLPMGAHAQSDWIDEFPSVTAVAHAAFEELKVTSAMSKLDMTHDDDSIAVNLAGTLNVLRQILYLKFIAEQPMPKAREDNSKSSSPPTWKRSSLSAAARAPDGGTSHVRQLLGGRVAAIRIRSATGAGSWLICTPTRAARNIESAF